MLFCMCVERSGAASLGEEGEDGFETHGTKVAFGVADAERIVLNVFVGEEDAL
jgi:hypothetical protein